NSSMGLLPDAGWPHEQATDDPAPSLRPHRAQLGETRTHQRRDGLEGVLVDARAQGFAEFDPAQTVWMEVQYDLDGHWGNVDDLDLRNAIMAHLDEVLGWTGLGRCDGGSIGSGAMEVACVVVDADIAQRVVGAALDGSRFPRFSRINVR
ncbi:hypothetical protein, partial [Dactylosporangium sp. NPDC049140]|uniref:hypothetical protein n=1 Tax=Dactylosporangium sp. NPDC049140 TaxID=3155647 RepID=UPI0033FB7FE8